MEVTQQSQNSSSSTNLTSFNLQDETNKRRPHPNQLQKLLDEESNSGSSSLSTSPSSGGLKQTISQAMMNSNLLNSLPKYIFQSDHARLASVKNILKESKEQQNREENLTNNFGEVSEYPIEFYEHQQHAIERHMSIK